MENNDNSTLTEEDVKKLLYGTVVAEILRLKQSSNRPSDSGEKPWWQKILESTGGTAIITVVIGGILGQMISCSIQKDLKEREFQQGQQQAANAQALIAYKEYIEQEKDTVKHAYELVGKGITSSEDLISLTSEQFSVDKFTGKDEDTIKNQRKLVREQYNTVDKMWRSEGIQLGLLMSYYHNGSPEVLTSWQNVQTSMTNYMTCAENWYTSNTSLTNPNDACNNERNKLNQDLKEMTTTLESARRYLWKEPTPTQQSEKPLAK